LALERLKQPWDIEARVLLGQPMLGLPPAAQGPDAPLAVFGGEVGQGVQTPRP